LRIVMFGERSPTTAYIQKYQYAMNP